MRRQENGNAFVYVLIAVVLFAALSFILVRQEDSKETGTITPETAKILATQLITTATQIKSALDQMQFAGTNASEMDFAKPGAFGAAPHFDKVFHPDGGGVTLPPLSSNALPVTTVTTPNSSWYLGRFNNIEWTPTTAQDIILTAYGINEMVCEEVNRIIIGTTDIPQLTQTARSLLVDVAEHGTANNPLTPVNCPDALCADQVSLCVQNSAGDRYAFFNILKTQ